MQRGKVLSVFKIKRRTIKESNKTLIFLADISAKDIIPFRF